MNQSKRLRIILFVSALIPSLLIAEPQTTVKHGVYARGDIRDSEIHIEGIPGDQLPAIITAATRPLQQQTEEQKRLIARLQHQLGVNEAQLQAFLQIIGEADVPPERIGTKLLEIAQDYQRLKNDLKEIPGEDTQIADLKKQARLALDEPDLAKADALLAAVEALQESRADQQALAVATTIAQRGEIAMTRLRYLDAAHRFAKAVARVPPGHEGVRDSYLNRQASALYKQGDEKGDNAALVELIQLYRVQLAGLDSKTDSESRASTQNNLGNALGILGARESGTDKLEAAVAAHREALKEWTRERVPLQWAITQNNLGNALQTLGARESGTDQLEAAVAAYREALKEWTRERVPLRWAVTQNNLGNALGILGEREFSTDKLEAAVVAFREALKERARERVPLQWAMTQNNLGNALGTLGKRESGTDKLEAAVAAITASRDLYLKSGYSQYAEYFKQRISEIRSLIAKRKKR